jgi:hypothetical protein
LLIEDHVQARGSPLDQAALERTGGIEPKPPSCWGSRATAGDQDGAPGNAAPAPNRSGGVSRPVAVTARPRLPPLAS